LPRKKDGLPRNGKYRGGGDGKVKSHRATVRKGGSKTKDLKNLEKKESRPK